MRIVEAEFRDGILRPIERLELRTGERVNLIVVRRPDPRRWNLSKLAETDNQEEAKLAELGLAEWTATLEEGEQH